MQPIYFVLLILSTNVYTVALQYNAIGDNKSLTVNQAKEQTDALLDTIKTPYLKRLIYALSYPEYAEGEEPLFSVNAAKRR